MHRGTNWVIIDTETTGIRSPIFAVEIAAQRMCGWQREGAPFRVLLNHDVEIEPQAQAVHGYSRTYLQKHGLPPHEAHARFRDYVGPSPLVAHNLSYDWDRVLYPEYQRLGVPVAGRRGFCAMTLARRVVVETSRHGLDALASQFCPSRAVEHNALPDTLIVVELFEKVYGPRLTDAGITTFEAVAKFSSQTPVIECRRRMMSAETGATIRRESRI
jgi:DNA polymerase III epsilon subunit-like protein